MKRVSMASFALIATLAAGSAPAQQAGKEDEKVAKQLERLDAQLIKALTDLAKKYDADKVPEAAHFFASCALGFGAKDEAIMAIKKGWEASVYLGKMRGGDLIKETAPITGLLGSLSTAYKKHLDPLIARARKGQLAESQRKMMFEAGQKYEIARGAHEYVQAVQRFNALRRAMALRAILWDFEASSKLIQVVWYVCETGDWERKELRQGSPFFSQDVEYRKYAGGPHKLGEVPDVFRSYALVRQQILNPNSRTLQLGFWGGGPEIDYFCLYAIPLLPYRDDIPTPTQRFKGETLVQDWVDLEDTFQIGKKKIPYARYPYAGELDAPAVFSNGKGASEQGWANSEHAFRDRAGVPIMLRFYGEATLSGVQSMVKEKSGREHRCRTYLSGDQRVQLEAALPTILLLPESGLKASCDYTVTIKCKLDDTPFETSWDFRTRGN